MSANDQQVGGTHYKTSYEHWDWVLKLRLEYLEGCATKYVTRWRKKDGVDGLRKALHYLNKLDENRGEALSIAFRAGDALAIAETARFAQANALTPLERSFCERLATWSSAEDLAEAREILLQLMDEVEEKLPDSRPVPLTEENHHAQRVGQSDEDYLGA